MENDAPMHGEHLPTKLFTLTELFGWYDGTPHCHECGATVDREQRDVHRVWHDKVANQ